MHESDGGTDEAVAWERGFVYFFPPPMFWWVVSCSSTLVPIQVQALAHAGGKGYSQFTGPRAREVFSVVWCSLVFPVCLWGGEGLQYK